MKSSQENPLPLAQEMLADRGVAMKVIGIGGAGSNAVDRLKMDNLARMQLAILNTDAEALSGSPIETKLMIGAGITRGLSTGGDPELGRLSAEADRDKIAALVARTDLVFLVAGMGGGTGSGAAPVVAEICRQAGALVIAFVNLPFSFEGGRRLKQAEEGLAELRRCCDAVIPLPNDMLIQVSAEGQSALESFALADEWIGRGVRSLWAMLHRTGLINLDYATLRQAFSQKSGKTLFGLGSGSGDNPVTHALESLKQCPLLHTPEFSRKADRLLVNIIGGPELSLANVNDIMAAVSEHYGRDAHIFLGAVIDEQLAGRVEICIIGTSDVPRGAVRRGVATVLPSAEDTKLPLQDTPVRAKPNTATRKPSEAVTVAAAAEPASAQPAKPATKQDEFFFNKSEPESRGWFDHTDRNLFDGQDLDVPTYLRKGIKLAL
jgi:cell division protein FtsZ